jgi:hypothetical protein
MKPRAGFPERPRVRRTPSPKQLELFPPDTLALSYWRDGQPAFDDSREEKAVKPGKGGKRDPAGKF